MLFDLAPAGTRPLLWQDAPDLLAPVLDDNAAKFGQGAIGYGAAGFEDSPAWAMTRDHLSPCFTTRWGELLTIG